MWELPISINVNVTGHFASEEQRCGWSVALDPAEGTTLCKRLPLREASPEALGPLESLG